MSKIDDLIRRYCPSGVPYKELDEIGSLYGGLTGKSKPDFTDGNAKYVTYMNIYSNISVDISRRDFVKVSENERQHRVQRGDVLFTGSSENPEECGMSSVLVDKPEEVLYLNSFCFGFHLYDDETLLPEFSKYLFRGANVRKQISKTASGVTRFNISKKRFIKIKVPVPPLEVQKEIANILDKFTQLEAELSAELEARRAQYEFYRNQLLTFTQQDDQRERDVKWLKLGDICNISRGRVMSKDYLSENAGDFPVYSSQTANNGIFGKIDSYDYDFESITWTTDGANAGSVFYHNDEKFSITNVCGLLRVKTGDVSARFLYYALQMLAGGYVNAGMGNPKLMSNVMATVKVPVPPIDQQIRAVNILDKFDSLINDLSSGLPAEINARRQQYEYYRNKLLTFQELPA